MSCYRKVVFYLVCWEVITMTVATLEERTENAHDFYDSEAITSLPKEFDRSASSVGSDFAKGFFDFSVDYILGVGNAVRKFDTDSIIRRIGEGFKRSDDSEEELPITLYDACNLNREYIIDALLVPLRKQGIHVPNSVIRKHSTEFFSGINDNTDNNTDDNTSIFELHRKLFEFQAKLYENVSTSIENGFSREEGIKTGEYQSGNPVNFRAEDFLKIPLAITKEIVDCASPKPKSENTEEENFGIDKIMSALQEMLHGERRSSRTAFALATLTSLAPIVISSPAYANEKVPAATFKVENPKEVSSTAYAEMTVSGGLEKTLKNNGISPSIADALMGMQKRYFPLKERDNIIAKNERGEYTGRTFNEDGTYEGQRVFVPKKMLDRNTTSRLIPYSIIIRKLFSDGTAQYVRHVIDQEGNSYKRIVGKRKKVASVGAKAIDEEVRAIVFGGIVNGALKSSGLPHNVLEVITRKAYQSNPDNQTSDADYANQSANQSDYASTQIASTPIQESTPTLQKIVETSEKLELGNSVRESYSKPSEEEEKYDGQRQNGVELVLSDTLVPSDSEQLEQKTAETNTNAVPTSIDATQKTQEWMMSREYGLVELIELPVYDKASLKALRALNGSRNERKKYAEQLEVAPLSRQTESDKHVPNKTFEETVKNLYERKFSGASGKAVSVNTENVERLAILTTDFLQSVAIGVNATLDSAYKEAKENVLATKPKSEGNIANDIYERAYEEEKGKLLAQEPRYLLSGLDKLADTAEKDYDEAKQRLLSHQLKIAGRDSLINEAELKKYQAKARTAKKNLSDWKQKYSELARTKLDKYKTTKQELDGYKAEHYAIWSKEELNSEEEKAKSDLEAKIAETSKIMNANRLQRFNYAVLNDEEKARIVEIYNNRSLKTIKEVMEDVKKELGVEKLSRTSLYRVITDAKKSGRDVKPRKWDKLSGQSMYQTIADYYGTKPEIIKEIGQKCEEYDVPFYLALSLAYHESGFNNNARSWAGAIGIGQFMPGTAAMMGINPYDWRQNIDGMVRHIRDLLKGFDGIVPHALAAYNAGGYAVQQSLKRHGRIPHNGETENYVPNILNNIQNIEKRVNLIQKKSQKKWENKEF